MSIKEKGKAIKIAVASSDGIIINQHFGKATQFLIFELVGPDIRFIEIRRAVPPCDHSELNSHHNNNTLERSVEQLSDCRAVLCSRIGPAAASILKSSGILPLECPGFIQEILNDYAKEIFSQEKAP